MKIMIQDLKVFHQIVKMVLQQLEKGIFTSCKKMIVVLLGLFKLIKSLMIKTKNKYFMIML